MQKNYTRNSFEVGINYDWIVSIDIIVYVHVLSCAVLAPKELYKSGNSENAAIKSTLSAIWKPQMLTFWVDSECLVVEDSANVSAILIRAGKYSTDFCE